MTSFQTIRHPIVSSNYKRDVRSRMRRVGLSVVPFLILHIFANQVLAQEDQPRSDSSPPSTWEWVKGHRDREALFLGMQSLHLDGTGALGNNSTNEKNDLLAVQIRGVNVGTFINSHEDRSYFGGLSRTIHTKKFSRTTRMDIGYKVGLLYGYGDDLPNLGGFCPLILPTIGFTYRRLGVEIGFIPVGILTASFRIDIENIFPGSKK
jgi:hypothetical protein